MEPEPKDKLEQETEELIVETRRRLQELEALLQKARDLAAQQAEALSAIRRAKNAKK
jgi:hypothetical protein